MRTIKSIDILRENNKFIVRDVCDGGRAGQIYSTYTTLYSESQALTSARRRAALLKVKFLGIAEAVK